MKRRDFLKLPAQLAAIWGVAKSGIKKLPEEADKSVADGGASTVHHLDEVAAWDPQHTFVKAGQLKLPR